MHTIPTLLARLATLLLLLFIFTPNLYAQPGGGVTVSIAQQHTTVTTGSTTAVAVTFEFSNSLHIWPNKPIIPDGIDGLFPVATEVVLAEDALIPSGIRLLSHQGSWPPPDPVEVAAGNARVKIAVYHDKTTAIIPIVIDKAAPKGLISIPILVKYQACNDTTCFQPAEDPFTITFTIADTTTPSANADLFTGYTPPAEQPLTPAVKPTPTATPTQTPAATGPITIDLGVFGWKITLDGAFGYALLFVVALIGGFILNLTPCVLPVIPLKILGLQQQAGSRSRMLFLGFVMFCGLVFFWFAIGALLSLGVLRAISEISAYWQFNMAIAVFMALMGLGMFGLFTVGLPTWVYNIDVKHDSAKGSFGFGIMSAVLATPCVAPLMGGIAAGSAKLPTAVALLLFIFVGIGMGLPYLILAAYPRLVSWLPKAGPGSELLKQVLGMLMVAISLFFLGSALITLVAEYPWLAKQLHWWAVAIAVLIAAVWLMIRTFQITPSAGKRAVFSLLGILLTAAAFLWANSQTKLAETQWERQEAARLEAEKLAPGVITDQLWQPYTANKVDRSLADGKVVVMDFTADWCLICKTLEATVLHTTSVETALKASGARSFSVDVTSKKAEGWKRLKSFGQVGVPTLTVQGPGLKEPWVRNAYTIAEVVDAINQAKGATPPTPAAQAANP